MTIPEAKRTIVHGIGQAKVYGQLLVVMATGTGKSFLAMQITWKLQRAGFVDAPKPRLLYLADRNVLIDRSGNRESTSAFGENAIEHTDLTEADQFDPLVHPAWNEPWPGAPSVPGVCDPIEPLLRVAQPQCMRRSR